MIHPSKDNCCGCGVCEHICSHSAITIEADDFGFRYPKVNETLCTDCGLCEKVCPFNIINEEPKSQPQAYAIRHKNPNVVDKSRSGGFFTALTDLILQGGGVVYGAILTEQMSVEHVRAESRDDRDLMRGSKYAQSNMGEICKAVKQDLKDGRKVLFSGTPCQVEAIARFVGKRLIENLILVDVICHGVGSPEIWSKFINQIENIEGRKVVDANFRDKKKYGWTGLHKESFVLDSSPKRKFYPFIYYNDLHVRDCCQNCPYSRVPRNSDITLGDLWGFEKVVPEWGKNNNGISLVLANSEKGRALLGMCKDSVDCKPIELNMVMQPHLSRPITFDNQRRQEYSEDYRSKPFEFVLEKYHKVVRPSFSDILLNKVKMLIAK